MWRRNDDCSPAGAGGYSPACFAQCTDKRFPTEGKNVAAADHHLAAQLLAGADNRVVSLVSTSAEPMPSEAKILLIIDVLLDVCLWRVLNARLKQNVNETR